MKINKGLILLNQKYFCFKQVGESGSKSLKEGCKLRRFNYLTHSLNRVDIFMTNFTCPNYMPPQVHIKYLISRP